VCRLFHDSSLSVSRAALGLRLVSATELTLSTTRLLSRGQWCLGALRVRWPVCEFRSFQYHLEATSCSCEWQQLHAIVIRLMPDVVRCGLRRINRREPVLWKTEV